MLVIDASACAAALLDAGRDGRWAMSAIAEGPLFAPQLLPAEVATILRRVGAASGFTEDVLAMAYADLLDMPVTLVPFAPLAARIWELRGSVTAYDAWYVALAEELGCPLVTLDHRLTRAGGPRCEFRTP